MFQILGLSLDSQVIEVSLVLESDSCVERFGSTVYVRFEFAGEEGVLVILTLRISFV